MNDIPSSPYPGLPNGIGLRIDDLSREGLKVVSDTGAFRFGTDSVLLADFAAGFLQAGGRVCDLGAGNGVLCFLTGAKAPKTNFDAVEIQQRACELAIISRRMNAWQDRMRVHNIDLKNASDVLGHGVFAAVICNPPYGKVDSAILPSRESDATARFEVKCTLEDIFQASSKLLKNGGALHLIHQTGRLIEALDYGRKYALAPHFIRCVHPSAQKEAKHVLMRFIKGGKCELRWLPPFILYDENGECTKEAERIYSGRSGQ